MSDIFEKLKKNKDNAENNKDDVKTNVNNDVNVDVNSNVNVIVSKKQENKKVKRTYYLDPGTEKELSRWARKTNRDKSEIVEFALNYFFKAAELEA